MRSRPAGLFYTADNYGRYVKAGKLPLINHHVISGVFQIFSAETAFLSVLIPC